jgi:hypothetical protein
MTFLFLHIQCCSNKNVNSHCITNWAVRHEGLWGSGCVDPRFLDLGTSLKCVVSITPRLLYPRRKSPRYPLDARLGGPQNRSGRRGENCWPYLDSNSDSLVVQLVASCYTECAIPTLCCSNIQIKVIRLDSILLVSWLAAVLNTRVRFLVTVRIIWPLLCSEQLNDTWPSYPVDTADVM